LGSPFLLEEMVVTQKVIHKIVVSCKKSYIKMLYHAKSRTKKCFCQRSYLDIDEAQRNDRSYQWEHPAKPDVLIAKKGEELFVLRLCPCTTFANDSRILLIELLLPMLRQWAFKALL
jgi:hypothetical protein